MRQELKQFKDSYEALLQVTKNDGSILAKYNELVQANVQKDETIANLNKSAVKASTAVDVDFLRTEYDLKLQQANKKIEEKDAAIRELRLKVSRGNPRDSSRDPRSQSQTPKSPNRSRSNPRGGGANYVKPPY